MGAQGFCSGHPHLPRGPGVRAWDAGAILLGVGMFPFTSASLSLDQQGHLQGGLPPGQHHLPPGPLPGHTLHCCGGWSLCSRGGGPAEGMCPVILLYQGIDEINVTYW